MGEPSSVPSRLASLRSTLNAHRSTSPAAQAAHTDAARTSSAAAVVAPLAADTATGVRAPAPAPVSAQSSPAALALRSRLSGRIKQLRQLPSATAISDTPALSSASSADSESAASQTVDVERASPVTPAIGEAAHAMMTPPRPQASRLVVTPSFSGSTAHFPSLPTQVPKAFVNTSSPFLDPAGSAAPARSASSPSTNAEVDPALLRNGREVYDSGDVYEGQFFGNVKHGVGTYRSAKGGVYEGRWADGKRAGLGVMTFADQSRFEGHWREDIRDGFGQLTDSDGSVFSGIWKSSAIVSEAKVKFANGDEYAGEFQSGLPHGQGTYRFAEGSVYSGPLVQGLRHGFGRLALASGETYEGHWEYDFMSGSAKILFANGNAFQGHFSRGKMHGEGTYTYKDGDYYECHWQQNVKSGSMVYHFSSGDLLVGRYDANQPSGPVTFVSKKGYAIALPWSASAPTDASSHKTKLIAESTRVEALETLVRNFKIARSARPSVDELSSTPGASYSLPGSSSSIARQQPVASTSGSSTTSAGRHTPFASQPSGNCSCGSSKCPFVHILISSTFFTRTLLFGSARRLAGELILNQKRSSEPSATEKPRGSSRSTGSCSSANVHSRPSQSTDEGQASPSASTASSPPGSTQALVQRLRKDPSLQSLRSRNTLDSSAAGSQTNISRSSSARKPDTLIS
eukprot:m.316750 g.316750  ORF g.316750 m.316750 type:complete len:686 (-) comp55463_c0_seq3:46-2103(-)